MTWVHLIAFSRCGLTYFFCFFASHTQPAESTKKAHPTHSAWLAQRRGAAPCGAACGVAPCCALPCCAALCRVVPCFAALCLSYSMSSNLHFMDLFLNAVPVYSNNSSSTTVVCTTMCYVVVEPRAQHSTAQRNHPCTKQHTKHVSADQSTYQKKYTHVRTYMHAASGLFSWRTELLALASRLFAPKMLEHLLLHPSVIPIHYSL